MKKLHIILYIIFLIVFISFAYAYSISTFADGSSSGNLTFTAAGSDYVNLSVPYWASITSINIDLKGYNYTTSYPYNVTIRTNNEITYQNMSNFTGVVESIDLNSSSLQRCVYSDSYMDIVYNYNSYAKVKTNLGASGMYGFSSFEYYVQELSNLTKLSFVSMKLYGGSYPLLVNLTLSSQASTSNGVLSTSLFNVTGAGWVNVTFDRAVLNPSLTYYLILHDLDYSSGDSNSYLYWQNNNSNPYASGRMGYSSDGSSFDYDSSVDASMFLFYSDYNLCELNFTTEKAGILEYSNLDIDYLVPLNLTFRDEESNALIDNETFTVLLKTDGSTTQYSISSNNYQLNLSSTGLYDISMYSSNYPKRDYIGINISQSRNVFTAYLINSSSGSERTFYVRDSSVSPLENVYINFSRQIDGVDTQIAEEYTDYDGVVSLYLDSNYEYTITFVKSGYNTRTIDLEPIDSSYVITMVGSTAEYNMSVYEGIKHSFSPSDTLLNNNTWYNFTFTLNSTYWDLSNCTLRLLNGSTVLNESSVYTTDSCYIRIERTTGLLTNIASQAIYVTSEGSFTINYPYSVIYTYEGQFSLKNFLDDLSDFGEAGFDDFGRMMLALVVIVVILILVAKDLSFANTELLLGVAWALVLLFSYVGWFHISFVPDIVGLRKYFVFYLMSLFGASFIIRRINR